MIEIVIIHIFAFINFCFLEKKRVRGFFFGNWSIKKIFKKIKKILKNFHTGELHEKKYTFVQGAVNHTFF